MVDRFCDRVSDWNQRKIAGETPPCGGLVGDMRLVMFWDLKSGFQLGGEILLRPRRPGKLGGLSCRGLFFSSVYHMSRWTIQAAPHVFFLFSWQPPVLSCFSINSWLVTSVQMEVTIINAPWKARFCGDYHWHRPYGLVIKHSFWKSPLIVDFAIKNGDFPQLYSITRGYNAL